MMTRRSSRVVKFLCIFLAIILLHQRVQQNCVHYLLALRFYFFGNANKNGKCDDVIIIILLYNNKKIWNMLTEKHI